MDEQNNNNTPIPRTLETPPRTTGNVQQDFPILIDWFYRAYQVITQSVNYINTNSVSAGDNVSVLENDALYIGSEYYELVSGNISFKDVVAGKDPTTSNHLATKNYVDSTFSASSHGPVTVTDSSEIDFTLNVQNLTASIKVGSISSSKLDTGVTTSLGKADTALQSGANISLLTNDAGYVTDGLSEQYETVSKNLKSYPYALNYTGSDLTSIVYTLPSGTITKTLNYTSGVLTSIVLSGDTPSGIDLTKTLSYTGTDLTGVAYS